MAVNPNWPLVVDQIAFTGDPNDPNSTPSYTDLTSRVRSFESSRGRQYEIDQNQTGEAHLVVSDSDEVLNPANSSAPAPYNGNIKPYRRYLRQAQWPPVPVGGAVNLLNLNTLPNNSDTTFESYGVGIRPAWLDVVGGTNPTVQAANPWQGTKSLQWTVAANSTQQGIVTNAPCIPGRQYTVSAYVRQTTANTQLITIDAAPAVSDGFNRTASNGWGTADSGQTWVVDGTASQFSVSSGTGQHSVNALNTTFRSRLTGPTFADVNLTYLSLVNVAPSGSYIRTETYIRWVDANNYYSLQLHRQPGGAVDLQLVKVVGGTPTALAALTSSVVHTPGISLYIRVAATGTTLQARIWRDGTTEPTTWEITATDTAISAGTIGIGSLLPPGSTNTLPVTMIYAVVAATGTLAGTSTTTTGGYVRLSATFTALQPNHRVKIVANGAAAATVNLDAMQHEQGSSASAYASTGPTIYTTFAGYVERWPTSWNHQGTYGLCTLTCVDAMAVLAGTDMHTEYRGALLAKSPGYYWPLTESQGATTFAEVSGSGGPPLVRVDDPGSPGPDALPVTFEAGTQTNIAGDPGGTGLKCTGDDRAGGTFGIVAKVCARAGTLNGVGFPTLNFPTPGTTGYTIAFWLARNPNDTNGGTGLEGWSADGTGYFRFYLDNSASPMAITWTAGAPGSDGTGFWLHATDTWADGKPHLYVLTVSNSGGNSTGTMYIDNNQIATDTQALSGNPWSVAFVNVGGDINYSGTGGDFPLKDAVYAHVGLWSRALSSSERSDLWTAGQGYPGETSGQRIARLLSVGGYTGPTAIDNGQSVMGASTVTEGAALLDACQQVTLSENGNLYVEAGTVTAKSRTDRYLKTTAKWVFGENQAGGEAPYETDIAYDYDPTRVVNDVTVTRVNGAKANATDATSQKQYFRRSYQRTIGVQSDLETIDAANYLLSQGKQPIQRVSRLSIKPSANPALWPVALGVRIGDRVTVKRRTSAGLTMSSDYFIEKVDHQNEPGSWVTTFQMSPVSRYQVGIFDDATYGRFDSTLVFGY